MDAVKIFGTDKKEKKAGKLSDSEIDKIWAQYVKDKNDKELRDKLIVQYIYLIKYVVGRMRINLPATICTEDISGYGVEGLIDAIDRFIPSKGVRFETYAVMRVRGAIIDKVRSQDWVPRGARTRFKKVQQTIAKLQATLGRTPTTTEIAEDLETTKEKIEAIMAEMQSNTMVSIYDKRGDSSSSDGIEIIDTIQDSNSKDPLNELESKDVKNQLSKALGLLPERERMILALYYHENMTLKEIGEAISISESRVCQLHAQAIMKLRKILSSDDLKLQKAKK
ncbi:MAG: FliA/WhiG family RNA polymerase sigma factor [bacterium]